MDKLKLLIADGNEEFRTELEHALQDRFHIRSCASGEEALSLLQSFRPQILALNLMLSVIDGITLLEEARRMGIRPRVLATTPQQNAYVLDAVVRLEVDYVMLRPCRIRAAVARILDMARPDAPAPGAAPAPPPDPRARITALLLSLGIPTRRKGFGQLREAILLVSQNSDITITKELYPAVAAICNGDPKQIERTIRSAIDEGWQKRDPQLWQLYFPPKPGQARKRPTNGEFITRLAEILLAGDANSILPPSL